MAKVIAGAEQYYWRKGSSGVLLLHGYTGSPSELKLLGEFLSVKDYSVLGVRLPGHGTTPEELNETTWHDWYAEAERCYEILHKDCSKIIVIGLSMGALLAMKLVSAKKADKAVFLAAPIFIYDQRTPFVGLVKHFIKWIKKGSRAYNVPSQYNIAYSVMPLKALDSLLALIKEVKKNVLEKIDIPCLIIQSKSEHTVKPASANYIFEHLKTKEKKLVWIEQAGHILTLSDEKTQVFKAVADFIQSEE